MVSIFPVAGRLAIHFDRYRPTEEIAVYQVGEAIELDIGKHLFNVSGQITQIVEVDRRSKPLGDAVKACQLRNIEVWNCARE